MFHPTRRGFDYHFGAIGGAEPKEEVGGLIAIQHFLDRNKYPVSFK